MLNKTSLIYCKISRPSVFSKSFILFPSFMKLYKVDKVGNTLRLKIGKNQETKIVRISLGFIKKEKIANINMN